MHPYQGLWVLYRLTGENADYVNRQGLPGAMVRPGDVYPALVTVVNEQAGTVNLEVHPDNAALLLLPRVYPSHGEHDPGTWRPAAAPGPGQNVRAGGSAMVSGGDMNIGFRQ